MCKKLVSQVSEKREEERNGNVKERGCFIDKATHTNTHTHRETIPKADKFTNIKFTHTHTGRTRGQGGAQGGSTLKNESDNLTTYLVK